MSDRTSGETTRRTFLRTGAALGAGLAAGCLLTGRSVSGGPPSSPYTLPPLPYPAEALEPVIDAATMQIHHGKHHAAYVEKLNDALKAAPDLQKLPLEDLLAKDAAKVPEAIRQAVVNNGGGHVNHSLFWKILGPKGSAASEPKGRLLEAIRSAFGSLESLKQKMNDAGLKQFGSGWAWLARSADGKLEVFSTANQDSPILKGKTPVLGIDVWEHAYYLKYQNRRADYLQAIWSVINWEAVERNFQPS